MLKKIVKVMYPLLLSTLWIVITLGWIRSYWICDVLSDFNFKSGEDGTMIESDRGWIRFKRFSYQRRFIEERSQNVDALTWTTHSPIKSDWMGAQGSESEVKWYFCGFGFAAGDYDPKRIYGPMPFKLIVVPSFFVSAVTAVPLLVWLRREFRQRKKPRWKAQGRCVNCGYDLRASESRCPECGEGQATHRAAVL